MVNILNISLQVILETPSDNIPIDTEAYLGTQGRVSAEDDLLKDIKKFVDDLTKMEMVILRNPNHSHTTKADPLTAELCREFARPNQSTQNINRLIADQVKNIADEWVQKELNREAQAAFFVPAGPVMTFTSMFTDPKSDSNSEDKYIEWPTKD